MPLGWAERGCASRKVCLKNKRAGLFWGWLLRVVGAALVSRLVGRGCRDGEGTVR